MLNQLFGAETFVRHSIEPCLIDDPKIEFAGEQYLLSKTNDQ